MPSYDADMAPLAYLLLPITGLVAYLFGDARARLHGLQAIAFGLVWPLCLYGAASTSAAATRIVFAVGALLWLGVIVATAAGRDPVVPGLRGWLARLAEDDPRGSI